ARAIWRSNRVRLGALLLAVSLASSLSPGTPQTALAAGGAALAFDGASQYVTFGAATGLDTPTFTLEAWVRWTGGGIGTSTGFGGLSNAIPLITKGRAEADSPPDLNMNYFLGISA